MGSRMKKLVIGLLILSLTVFGVRFSAEQWTGRRRPGPSWSLPRIEDQTPAPPGTGPDGLYATWAAVRWDGLGEHHASMPSRAGMRLTFTEEKLLWEFDSPKGKEFYDGVYHIEPDRNPKVIYFGEPNQAAPEKLVNGFYEVKGDRLIIWGGAEGVKASTDATSFRLELKRVLPRP